MELDKEVQRFCGALLTEIANEAPLLAKQVTKRVGKIPSLRDDKERRKLAKAAIFYKEHNNVYEIAAGRLRGRPEWISPVSNPKISTFYENIYKLIGIEPLPGSVESKYGRGQGPA
jgi:hypothetical protein